MADSQVDDSAAHDDSFSIPPVLQPLYGMFFVEIYGWALTIPVIGFFAMKELGLDEFQLGTVLSAFSLAQILGSVALGRFSDAWGRWPLIIFCFGWAAAGFFVTAFVRNYVELLFARAIAGLSGGTWPMCQAFILDVVDPRLRGKFIGFLGATFAFGLCLGPGTTAGLLASGIVTNRRVIFGVSGILIFIAMLVGVFFLSESLPEERRRPLCKADPAGGSALEDQQFSGASSGSGEVDGGKARSHRNAVTQQSDWEAVNLGLLLIWSMRFFVAFGQVFIYSMYAPLIEDLFGFGDIEMGILLTGSGLLSMFIQAIVFPRVVRLLGPRRTVMLGCAFISAGLFLLPTTRTLWVHLCFMSMFSLGGGLAEPGTPVTVALYVSASHLGFGNGWAASFRGLAAVFGPLVGGFLYTRVGVRAFFLAGACALVGGFLVLMADCFAEEVSRGLEENEEEGKCVKGEIDERTPLVASHRG